MLSWGRLIEFLSDKLLMKRQEKMLLTLIEIEKYLDKSLFWILPNFLFFESCQVCFLTAHQRVAIVDWTITDPQIRQANTGISWGSKGPSCDGNSFFFHNRTRRIYTHKDVGVGMEWHFGVYTWKHNSHFFLFSLQPHKSQSTSQCRYHSMSGMPVFAVCPGL